MKALDSTLKKQVKAEFKGTDSSDTYEKGLNYLLHVEEDKGVIVVTLGTGKGKRIYNSIEEYKKDWEEIEIQDAKRYSLTITYNEDGTPNLSSKNSGMAEADILMCLQITISQILAQITGGGK